MKRAYTIYGREFPAQAALELEVRSRLLVHGLDRLFYDDFVAAVINATHPELIATGQRCCGWFSRLSYEEQLRRGMDTWNKHGGGPVLVAHFAPCGRSADISATPWRSSRTRYSDLATALLEE